MVHLGNDWDGILAEEFKKDYYLKIREILKREYPQQNIYPDMYDIFNALKYTSYKDVKAVIIGQDPYHQPGQAHGLCFSAQSTEAASFLGAGSRALFFGEKGCGDSTLPAKYL